MAILKDLIVNGASRFIGKLTASTAEIGAETVTTINGVTVGNSPKFTDTTYESKTAASGGTDVSLVTTGEKYTWNNKSSLTLGTTSSTAYRGDRGASAYAHAVTNKGSAFTSGLYKITTNSEGHVTAATAVQKSDITALGIPAQDTTYTPASETPLMDGTAAVGTSAKYAREDHRHPVDTSRAAASHTHSADNIVGSGYLNVHPENNPTLIPFMHNDIAFLKKRGGSTVIKYDGVEQTVDISNVFDGSGSYWAINPTGTTAVVIELTLHKTFGWTNWIYVDFGGSSWRSKAVKVEVKNESTAYPNDAWTEKYKTTTNSLGHVAFVTSHTPVGADNAGAGFNKIRFTFNDWATSTIFRIAQLGVYNYGSNGLREPFMSRGLDDPIYRNITPQDNNTYALGSSSKKWSNVYATTFTGNLTGTASDVATQGAASDSTARHIWFSSSGTETRRAHNDSLKYTPSTNTISANISGTVNGHTVNKDVPSDAVFTDTTALTSMTGILPVAHGGTGNDDGIALSVASVPTATVDSTSTATAFTVQVPEFANETALRDGLFFYIYNNVIASASGWTLDVNGLGAKPVYNVSGSRTSTAFALNKWFPCWYSSTLVEDGCWIIGYLTDADTTGYYIRTNSSTRPAADKGYRYRIWFSSADNTKWVPANTSTSTGATASRTPNTRPINPFGPIIYYSTNGTTEANANLSATASWQQYVLVLGYSFNTTGAALVLTYPAPVYIKCSPQSDGSATLQGYTQTLPSTEDGYIYIYLGQAYDATHVELRLEHPVYWYKNSKIQPYVMDAATVNGHTVNKDVPSNAVFTDTTYNLATTSTAGLLSAADKIKLDSIITSNANSPILAVETSSFSSLPVTITSDKITENHYLVESTLSNPAAQTGDWTVTTTNGSMTISGTISGSTTATIMLGRVDTTSATILVFDIASFSSLPVTVTDSRITSYHYVLHTELGTPEAQTDDWTVTTGTGSMSIAGTISGSTTMRVILGTAGSL